MQLKGLVKFFTAALILISLYQLSFTFLVRNVEDKARAKAERQAKAMMPGASKDQIDSLAIERYNAITDSMLGKKVVNLFGAKYTYQEAKGNELNLGLDLQGGMNVTLDVSLEDLVRALSNNPEDPALNAAIQKASSEKLASQDPFVTLFGRAWGNQRRLAELFIKPGVTDITINSSNDEVLAKIRREADGAIRSTYEILQKRIDKFGVAQPTISLDANRGVISVELAGLRNPELVRQNLQATARLQFWEQYNQPGLQEAVIKADAALAAALSGKFNVSKPATAAVDTTRATDTTGTIAGAPDTTAKPAVADAAAMDTTSKPLLSLLNAQPDRNSADPAASAYIYKYNLKKFLSYLDSSMVKSALPANAKFLVGAENDRTRFDNNAVLPVYVVRRVNGSDNAKLEGDRVTDARSDFDQTNGRRVVNMEMDAEGARIWKKMTEENKGSYVMVALDDRVYSAPIVNDVIEGGATQISGSFSQAEADNLANILKVGKLPAPAHIVQEQVVGPTLGAENVTAGMNSLILSFVVIFLLMLVYYNTGGIVANIALILNVFFTLGLLSMWGATLTMPGIAGLVLTIGMAVDTNVIVFERIKEELTAGKGYKQAVEDGYKRSYAPVLDGHITQFLTAAILFYFGLGPVKGFATTQMLGLFLSVFCGLLVSRLVTEMWTNTKNGRERHFKYFTGLSKSIFRKAHFRFIEIRKYTYIVSGIVFALGIASYFNGYDKGVEFAGGRSYTVQLDKKVSGDELREKLAASFNNERPIVKTVGTNNTYNITTTYLVTDTRKEASAEAQQKLYEGLTRGGFIPAMDFEQFRTSKYFQRDQTVTPTISESLRKDSIKATIISLVAIFLYILIRFRKWQYSLGTIFALLHDVCITLAVFSFLRGRVPFALELDQHFIAAILTVIGFSMNDTVIVFDRVREYFRKSVGEDKKSVVNRAINDTLSRTVMTSLTVFLTVLILFIFGGEVTRGFAFAMLIGVITGTYSSIFVAAPFIVDLDKGDTLKNEVDREAQIEELKKLA